MEQNLCNDLVSERSTRRLDSRVHKSLRVGVSCEAPNPTHRGDVMTTPPTRRTTLETELARRNKLVEDGEDRNPASRASAPSYISGETDREISTTVIRELQLRISTSRLVVVSLIPEIPRWLLLQQRPQSEIHP